MWGKARRRTHLGHVQVHDADLVRLLDDLPRVLPRAVVLGRFRHDLFARKLNMDNKFTTILN